MAEIKELFPTFVAHGRLTPSARLNRELKREIQILSKIDSDGIRWSKKNYRRGYSSYGSLTNLHFTSPHFSELAKRLKPRVQQMVRRLEWNLMGRKLQMTTCWANQMGFGTHHTMHLHPLCALSGVYFVDCPRGSSIFKIEDPRMGQLMAAPPRLPNCQIPNRNYVELKPKAGEFVIFESWLRHEVPPHLCREPRVSVSFNFEWI